MNLLGERGAGEYHGVNLLGEVPVGRWLKWGKLNEEPGAGAFRYAGPMGWIAVSQVPPSVQAIFGQAGSSGGPTIASLPPQLTYGPYYSGSSWYAGVVEEPGYEGPPKVQWYIWAPINQTLPSAPAPMSNPQGSLPTPTGQRPPFQKAGAFGTGAPVATLQPCQAFTATVVPGSNTSNVTDVFTSEGAPFANFKLIGPPGLGGSQNISATYVGTTPLDYSAGTISNNKAQMLVTVTTLTPIGSPTGTPPGCNPSIKIGTPRKQPGQPIGKIGPPTGGFLKAAGWSTKKTVLVYGGVALGIGAAGTAVWYYARKR